MRFLKFIILTVISLQTYAQDFSGDWQKSHVSSQGEHYYAIPGPDMTMLIEDKSTQKGESTVILFNTTVNFKSPMKLGEITANSLASTNYFNCNNSTYSVIGDYLYPEKFGKGKLINSESYNELLWFQFKAEQADALKNLKAACGNVKVSGYFCYPTAQMSRVIREQSKQNAFGFSLDFKERIAIVELDDKSQTEFTFEREYGEGEDRFLFFKKSDGVHVKYYPNTLVAIIGSGANMITAGQCKSKT